jgi:formylmethanofuran:tetrahydromethanopterin formyltransferase
MQVGPTVILDTFAEAFRMRYARLVVCVFHWHVVMNGRDAEGHGH